MATMQSPKTPSPQALGSCSQYDFTEPEPLTDVTLVVEGTELYTSRYMLASASAIFRNLFSSDAKCNASESLPLPDDSLEDIHKLLAWMTPSVRLSLSDCECQRLVPVAYKYRIKQLLLKCDGRLARQFTRTLKDDKERLDFLILAQNYRLNELKGCALQYFALLDFAEFSEFPRFKELREDILCAIYEKRVLHLESIKKDIECKDDVNLVVEDKIIPASRALLSSASPVFQAMLLSDSFRESDAKNIPLVGKAYDDIKYMFDFISLPDTPPLTEALLAGVLQASDEYLIAKLKAHCADFMAAALANKAEGDDETLQFFLLSQKYDVPTVMSTTLERLARMEIGVLEKLPSYDGAKMHEIFLMQLKKLTKK